MGLPASGILDNFKCQSGDGTCLMELHKGLTDEYRVDGTTITFQGEILGALDEQSVSDIICGNHCKGRFVDEILGTPATEVKPSLSIVSRYSRKSEPKWFGKVKNEGDDFD